MKRIYLIVAMVFALMFSVFYVMTGIYNGWCCVPTIVSFLLYIFFGVKYADYNIGNWYDDVHVMD